MKSVNTDVAYDFIRKRILSGEYPPGHALLTETLADEIEVSRTPIRDALRKPPAPFADAIRAHFRAKREEVAATLAAWTAEAAEAGGMQGHMARVSAEVAAELAKL